MAARLRKEHVYSFQDLYFKPRVQPFSTSLHVVEIKPTSHSPPLSSRYLTAKVMESITTMPSNGVC